NNLHDGIKPASSHRGDVLLKSALANSRTNLGGSLGADLAQVADDVPGRMSNQNFASQREELLDACPGIGDKASPCPRSFKDPGGRREANIGHRLPIDVQDHAGGTIDAVMVAGAYVADPAHVFWQ